MGTFLSSCSSDKKDAPPQELAQGETPDGSIVSEDPHLPVDSNDIGIPKGKSNTAGSTSEAIIAERDNQSNIEGSTTYKIDPSKSVIVWAGYKQDGGHEGTLKLAESTVSFLDGKPVGGKVLVDLSSLEVTDNSSQKEKKNLRDHLLSADFFDIKQHPFIALFPMDFTPDKVPIETGSREITSAFSGFNKNHNGTLHFEILCKENIALTSASAKLNAEGQNITISGLLLIPRDHLNLRFKSDSENSVEQDLLIGYEIHATTL